MNKFTKAFLLLLPAAIAVFIILNLRGKSSKPERVMTEKAALRTVTETVEAGGKIFPETEIMVSAENSGKVTMLKVAEGDVVKKGQELARINGVIVKAPINGVVLSLRVKEGQSVSWNSFTAGTELMTIADMSALEARVDVGESDIIRVNTGDSAELTTEAYNNRTFRGVVTRIAVSTKAPAGIASVNEITAYEVRIRLDSSSYSDLATKILPFRPGMNVRAGIRTKTAEHVLTVPAIAVTAREGLAGADNTDSKEQLSKTDAVREAVFVVQQDGTVKMAPVKTGIRDIRYIEITEGIKEGDEVVTGPYNAISKLLKDGSKIKIISGSN